MKENLIIIPLDSRPVNTRLPVAVAATAGFRTLLPPIELLGRFRQAADIGAIIEWLIEALQRRRYPIDIIISADMIAYGGLVQSRKPQIKFASAAARIDSVLDITSSTTNAKTYIFSTILRDSVTATDEKTLALWLQRMGDPDQPSDPVRERNHALNLHLIEQLAAGRFDFLLTGKEDTAAGNPFAGEIMALRDKGASLGDRFHLTAGTDELCALCAARAAATNAGKHFSVFIDADAAALSDIRPYEPIPLGENITAQAQSVSCTAVTSPEAADFIIMPFSGSGGDIFLDQIKASPAPAPAPPPEVLDKFLSRLTEHIDAGRAVSIPDIWHSNAACPQFIDALLDRKIFYRLLSYAGWNTAGNSTGTVIAHSAATLCGGAWDARRASAAIRYLTWRLADDHLFANMARDEVARAIDGHLAFENPRSADAILFRRMFAITDSFSKRVSGTRFSLTPSGNFSTTVSDMILKKAVFPWRRLFEADVELNISCKVTENAISND